MPDYFRKTDRDFAERIFRNAHQQEMSANLGSETRQEFLLTPDGNLVPVKFESAVLQIDEQGLPIVHRKLVNVVAGCGHRLCGAEQANGMCRYNHIICHKCVLYTCSICGEKLCDKDVMLLDDETPYCPEHEEDVRRLKIRATAVMLLRGTVAGLLGHGYDE